MHTQQNMTFELLIAKLNIHVKDEYFKYYVHWFRVLTPIVENFETNLFDYIRSTEKDQIIYDISFFYGLPVPRIKEPVQQLPASNTTHKEIMREQDKDYQASLLTDRTKEVRDDFNKQVNQIEQDIFNCCDNLKHVITQYQQKERYSQKGWQTVKTNNKEKTISFIYKARQIFRQMFRQMHHKSSCKKILKITSFC